MKSLDEKIAQKKPPLKTARMVETIFGCKWSLTVFHLLRMGINRPGQMVRSTDGLTTKVLNDCLRRNVEFGILARRSFAELPPRVEYSITPFGERFVQVLDQLEALQEDIDDESSR